MLVKCLSRRIILLICLALMPLVSHAANWKAIEASYLSGEFFFGGETFSDGQYTSGSPFDDSILRNSGFGLSYSSLHFLEFGLSHVTTPQVDIGNMRANFSSLVFIGRSSDGIPVVGWEVGNHDWVPIVKDDDGNFTASWITPDSFNGLGSGGYDFSITFIALPLPPALYLFGAALAGLFALKRKA